MVDEYSSDDYEEVEDESETDSEEDEEKKKQKKIAYVCNVCQAMFKDPGMCPNCDNALKKKAE